MKCEVSRKWLEDVLAAAAAILPPRSVNPVARCVRLSAEADGLYVEAMSGTGMSVRKRVQHAKVLAEGQAVVRPTRLIDWLGMPGDAMATLEVRKNRLWLGRASDDCIDDGIEPNAAQMGLVDAEFMNPKAVMEGAALARAMEQVLVAVNPKKEDGVTPSGRVFKVSSVLVRCEAGRAFVEGTDMTGLCQSRFEAEADSTCAALLPVAMAHLVAEVAGGGPVRFGVRGGRVAWFAGDGWCVSGVEVAGKPPPMSEILRRADGELTAVVGVADATRAVEAALLGTDVTAEDKMPPVVVAFAADRMRATGSGHSSSAARVAPCQYGGPDTAIRLCGTRLRRFLRACDAKGEVTFRFADSAHAVVLEPDEGRSYLLMPMVDKPSGGA